MPGHARQDAFRLTFGELMRHQADQRAASMQPLIEEIRASGIITYAGIAKELNRREVPTARRGKWYPTTVLNLLSRSAAAADTGSSNNP